LRRNIVAAVSPTHMRTNTHTHTQARTHIDTHTHTGGGGGDGGVMIRRTSSRQSHAH
jgi:hypothetical protein